MEKFQIMLDRKKVSHLVISVSKTETADLGGVIFFEAV